MRETPLSRAAHRNIVFVSVYIRRVVCEACGRGRLLNNRRSSQERLPIPKTLYTLSSHFPLPPRSVSRRNTSELPAAQAIKKVTGKAVCPRFSPRGTMPACLDKGITNSEAISKVVFLSACLCVFNSAELCVKKSLDTETRRRQTQSFQIKSQPLNQTHGEKLLSDNTPLYKSINQ